MLLSGLLLISSSRGSFPIPLLCHWYGYCIHTLFIVDVCNAYIYLILYMKLMIFYAMSIISLRRVYAICIWWDAPKNCDICTNVWELVMCFMCTSEPINVCLCWIATAPEKYAISSNRSLLDGEVIYLNPVNLCSWKLDWHISSVFNTSAVFFCSSDSHKLKQRI